MTYKLDDELNRMNRTIYLEMFNQFISNYALFFNDKLILSYIDVPVSRTVGSKNTLFTENVCRFYFRNSIWRGTASTESTSECPQGSGLQQPSLQVLKSSLPLTS